MRKYLPFLLLCLFWTQAAYAEDIGRVDMHRLYHPITQEHFYTGDQNEKNHLIKVGWQYEGIGFHAPKKSNTPVYRLYHPGLRDHHYTTSTYERDTLVAYHGWRDEGIGWYSSDMKSIPIYRLYQPQLQSGAHHYTASRGEQEQLRQNHGWRDEGIAWYGLSTPKDEIRIAGPKDVSQNQTFIPSSSWLKTYRQAMLNLVNQERRLMGRRPVKLYKGDAQNWSQQMVEVNTLYHGSTDGSFESIWQNVAYSYVSRRPEQAAQTAFDQYMEEKSLWQKGERDYHKVGHYLNIIEAKLSYADFGIAYSGQVAYSTQNFK